MPSELSEQCRWDGAWPCALIPLGRQPGEGLLGPGVVLGRAFRGATRLFKKVVVSLFVWAGDVEGLQFLCIFIHTWHYPSPGSPGPPEHSVCGSARVSLTVSDVQHLSIHCGPSLELLYGNVCSHLLPIFS